MMGSDNTNRVLKSSPVQFFCHFWLGLKPRPVLYIKIGLTPQLHQVGKVGSISSAKPKLASESRSTHATHLTCVHCPSISHLVCRHLDRILIWPGSLHPRPCISPHAHMPHLHPQPCHLAHRPSLWGCAGAFVCTCWHACCASVPAEVCAGGLACLCVLAAGTSVRAGMSCVRACMSVW